MDATTSNRVIASSRQWTQKAPGLRRSELVSLQVEDVAIVAGALRLRIRLGKTDQNLDITDTVKLLPMQTRTAQRIERRCRQM